MTPTELDYSQIKVDLESFGRRLRLKWHFRESEDFSEYPAFRPRSKFNPRHKDAAIELYLSKLEEELMSISAEGNNYSNVSREESKAINSLRSDRTIVVKEADKGSGVVVWDREDYITEAESQLGDSEVYSRLDNDPSERLHQIISDTLKRISDRGDLDQTTLDYLMVNNPRLGRFYLLPKIHKRLNSVPGRPVISNCGFFTENISAFLDHHLQPLAKKVRSYIKDTNHFLKKIMDLDGLPDGAILCTVDVVGLYPSIPHEEGLEALKGVLEHREDKTISTDTLLELAHVVLKNNFFEFNGDFYQQLRGTAIGTKCAPSYAILFLAALEEKLLAEAQNKPWVWCNMKYVGSTKTKFRQRFNVYKSYFRTYARKHNENSLDKGKPVPQASFFSHFFENGHNGNFRVGIKIIDGADDVFSLRRRELFWQYRLETFAPKGLNERAADEDRNQMF